jgi:hypothetical protein
VQSRVTPADAALSSEGSGVPVTIPHLPDNSLKLLHSLREAIKRLSSAIRQMLYLQGAHTADAYNKTTPVLNLEQAPDGPLV